MRFHGFNNLPEYCTFLRNEGGETETAQVLDALTTNFTQFLREEDHFKFLVKQAIPQVCGPGQKRFKIWSAACASGEEPYTMGFYLWEHFPPVAGWNWEIQATDISTKVLEKANRAIYPADRLSGLPSEWLRKYFQKGHNDWDGHFRVKQFIAERIKFQHLNLLSVYDFTDTFEVIFCRNVMIYFDRPTQEQVVKKLCQHLLPKGFLLVGHAESLTGLSTQLKCLRPSIYQKI
jgi:chemotaxis protein methyltransferase CheR